MRNLILSEDIKNIPFSDEFQTYLQKALGYVIKVDKENEIRVTHLIYAILSEKYDNIVIETLEEMKVDVEILLEIMNDQYRKKAGADIKLLDNIVLSKDLQNVIKKSYNVIKNTNTTYEILDLFLGLLKYDNELTELFEQNAVNYKVFKDTSDELVESFSDDTSLFEEHKEFVASNGPTTKKQNTKNVDALKAYGFFMHEEIKSGKINPCIGRTKEINNIIRVLNRRNKRNPLLIGPAGVGKTNVVEGLVQQIESGHICNALKNKKVFQLDLVNLIAGTMWRGQFEERMKQLITILKEEKDIILFVDEIHTIIGAGNSNGGLDVSNILKPALSKGEIQIIGATTLDEYKMYIEKDRALCRRFHNESINEPNIADTISILNGIKNIYEDTHNVKYTDDVIEKIVIYSDRFIHNKSFPDKAIEIMDDLGATVKSKINGESAKVQKIKKELELIKKKKKEINELKLYDKAEEILIKESEMVQKLHSAMQSAEDIKVQLDFESLKLNFESFFNIAYNKINDANIEGLDLIEEKLKNIVKGQDLTIEKIMSDVKAKRFFDDIQFTKKPLAYYFIGETGVGKTFLSKKIGEYLFDDKIFTIDCELFKESHSIANLIGSPFGYVDSNKPVGFFEFLKSNPYCLIVFNEIEKAHPSLYDLILTLLDEGTMKDKSGMEANVKDAIIVFTSNVGSSKIKDFPKIGYKQNIEDNNDDTTQIYMSELKKHFKPEFLNRIDDIFVFNKITTDTFGVILDGEIKQILDFLKSKNIDFEISDDTKNNLIEECRRENYGVRELHRRINKLKRDIMSQIQQKKALV